MERFYALRSDFSKLISDSIADGDFSDIAQRIFLLARLFAEDMGASKPQGFCLPLWLADYVCAVNVYSPRRTDSCTQHIPIWLSRQVAEEALRQSGTIQTVL